MLVDDHPLVRSGIRALLETLTHIEIIAETGEGHEAMRLIEELRPNVVLMDIAMPAMSGLEITALVKQKFPETKVVILTMHATEEYQASAEAAGADGYLLKSSAVSDLELAIDAVVQGEKFFCELDSPELVPNHSLDRDRDQTSLKRLTKREREVLELIGHGLVAKQIGVRLGISVKTVESHRASLMRRLGIYDIAGLVRFAIRVGLVKIDDTSAQD
jgi:DNA-binding NarL/FixJ family response regulator